MIHTFYIGQHSTPAKVINIVINIVSKIVINIVINIVIITVFVFLDLAINSKAVSGRKEGRRQKMFTSIFPFYMCNITTTYMFFWDVSTYMYLSPRKTVFSPWKIRYHTRVNEQK